MAAAAAGSCSSGVQQRQQDGGSELRGFLSILLAFVPIASVGVHLLTCGVVTSGYSSASKRNHLKCVKGYALVMEVVTMVPVRVN